MPEPRPDRPHVVVVGAGPAGLMAAETVAPRARVTVLERMPNPGRKLLIAGRGGLNLSHSEAIEPFLDRYGPARSWLEPAIRAFPPEALIAWAEGLGQPCFVGSSGRWFPRAMKASPLLRAWLTRLEGLGVSLVTRARFTDLAGNGVRMVENGVERTLPADAAILAMGGASWPRLGSDGRWAETLLASGLAVAPFRPANCGFLCDWSAAFADRFAGTPLKNIRLFHANAVSRGDMILARAGIEGGAVYPLSATVRDAIERDGAATVRLDLRPDATVTELAARLSRVRGRESISNMLRKALSLPPAAIALLRECGAAPDRAPTALADRIKAIPLVLRAPAGLDRAISSAGGLVASTLGPDFMLADRPGVFACGEMLDWEAPTGGYLLQASFATGRAAGRGALDWLRSRG